MMTHYFINSSIILINVIIKVINLVSHEYSRHAMYFPQFLSFSKWCTTCIQLVMGSIHITLYSSPNTSSLKISPLDFSTARRKSSSKETRSFVSS